MYYYNFSLKKKKIPALLGFFCPSRPDNHAYQMCCSYFFFFFWGWRLSSLWSRVLYSKKKKSLTLKQRPQTNSFTLLYKVLSVCVFCVLVSQGSGFYSSPHINHITDVPVCHTSSVLPLHVTCDFTGTLRHLEEMSKSHDIDLQYCRDTALKVELMEHI